MKARWICFGTLAAFLAVGFMAVQSDAALLTFQLEIRQVKKAGVLDANYSVDGNLGPVWGNGNVATKVSFNAVAILADADDDPENDGIYQGLGNVMSSGGALMGNILGYRNAQLFRSPPTWDGNAIDLNGDGYKDLGGKSAMGLASGPCSKDPNIGNVIFANSGSLNYVTPLVAGGGVILGTGEFRIDSNLAVVGQTQLNWVIVNLINPNPADPLQFSPTQQRQYCYMVDGEEYTSAGDPNLWNPGDINGSMGVGAPLVITFVPEPVTMVVLAAGASVLFLRRRRKQA